MATDEARLRAYVDIWAVAVDDVVGLLRSLAPEDWSRPTDCPGWDVHAVAAHLAHLESDLAGIPQASVEVPALDHVTSLTGAFTEAGVIARRSWTPADIVDELEFAADARLLELRAHPPTDAAVPAGRTPGDVGWTWETLLSNRPLDVWMHEQDVRRAVRRPGGLTGAPAAHTVGVFARSLAYVVGKRVAPPAGTSVVLDVVGAAPVHLSVLVGQDGRASFVPEAPGDPTVTLRTDLESYVVLCGGRRRPADVDVEVRGDTALGQRVLDALAVTP
jgi:uncharacterized protein (TIGR03083 family)